ncbi:NHL repeat-containing protein [Tropicimonas sediminicola]|uniref:DNA-binding beta-propeller fold protein YncE n=1 Tax=Tropicimonas sediminicola TaxID=1031541 RepID=A0A239J2H2_9RHOB|nr:NHL repeat-containing protein [Tropicimonas sediminicola]SNT00236.1 DNA-binding beta-propeller fold protein YncE [Tropicimonas sediminicola]
MTSQPSHLVKGLCLALLAAVPAAAQEAPAPFATFDSASEPVLNDPHDLAFGPDGRLYVADKFGSRIAVFDPETLDLLETFGDGLLPNVHDISFGLDGRAYVAVTGLGAVAIFDLSSGTPESQGLLGAFPRTEGALAHSNGRLYVMASGTGVLMAVEGEEVVATAGGMPGAHDVEEAPDGSIWVADNFNRRLVRFSTELEQLQVLDAPHYGFVGPRYLAIDDFGQLVVADQDAHRVLLIDPAADRLLGAIGTGTPGLGPNLLDDPEGVAVRGSTYYFADSDNNRIVKYVVVLN